MIALLSEDQSREVTFITFTRTSRRDTHSRLKQAFGESVFEQPSVLFPRTSTLHTYAKSLVHRYASLLGRRSDFSILVESKGEKSLLLQELIHDNDIDIDFETLSSGLYCFRCTGEWPQQFPLSETERIQAMDYFEKLLAFYNTFDMEGVVVAACEILSNNKLSIPRIFLQVDEFQDLNPLDHRLVNLAASNPLSQVVVVADDAQSIYGLRHAHYEGVRELWQSDDWEHIRFLDCHRLPAHILNGALDLISNEGYVGAVMNRKPTTGKRITTYQCTKSDLQIEAVAFRINQIICDESEKASYRDFLLLCPTTTLVDTVVSLLNDQYGIPAHKPTSSTMPTDYWRLYLILRILYNEDPLAFRQWLPILGFKEEDIHLLRKNAMDNGLDLVQYSRIIDDPRIGSFFENIDRVKKSVNNVDSFLASLRAINGVPELKEFSTDINSIVSNGSIPSYGRIIQHIYEKFGITDPEEEISGDDKVLVTTLHSAKGLEADYVFCMWMNSKFMPLQKRDLSEQKRILYVSLTRAKKDLVITFHEEFDTEARRLLKGKAMSPFLHEIRDHLDIRRIRAEDLR